MGTFFQRKSVRRFFTAFKWCRVAVLFAIFLLVTALSYLHLVGLPDYLKRPLLATLHERGFDAQFSRASLGWGPSINIEDATFRPTNEVAGPSLFAGWTHLDLNRSAFMRGHVRVDGFEVVRASMDIPVAATNQPLLTLTNINLSVTLSSNGLVVVKNGSATARGIHAHITGEITNVFAMRDWKWTSPPPSTNPPPAATNGLSGPHPLTAWEIIQKIQFSGTPELSAHFSADGRDRNTFKSELEFTASGAETPWAKSGAIHLRAACSQLLNSRGAAFFQAHLTGRDISTRWARCGDLSTTIDFSRESVTNFSALAHLTGRDVRTWWANKGASNGLHVAELQWDGLSTLGSPTYRPADFKGTLKLLNTDSPWGTVETTSLQLRSHRAENSPDDPEFGIWNAFKPFVVDWQAGATNIVTEKLKLDRIAFNGSWHPPMISIDTLQASMYHGFLNSHSSLDVHSREVNTSISLDFDPHQIAPLLTKDAQHWISFYHWDTPPIINASLRFVLPPWTDKRRTGDEDLRDSLQLAGDLSVGSGAFNGIVVSGAKSHYSYTNRIWNVTGLQVAGPGGSVDLDYTWNDLSSDYHFRFDSKLFPSVATPLLTEPQKKTLAEMVFSNAPELSGDVWGNWKKPELTGIAAKLASTNMVIRTEPVDQLNAQFDFTNRILRISNLKLLHSSGQVVLPLATINFASNIFTISNGESQVDPRAVRRALGKLEPPWMKELEFDTPPLVRASGSFVPGIDEGTDLRFFVAGGRLHWNKLVTDSVRGDVYYHVRTVEVTNVAATLFNSGTLQSWFVIDWSHLGTKFRSDAMFTNIDLAALAKELTGKPSKVEGMLNAHLYLGAPYNASDTNLYGNGWFHIHDALLWDIKIFGILSPMLNAIAPGSGDSKAREASASFLINNGVLDTEDLLIRSSGFRVLYRGTIDSKERLNARVEANLLRDTPMVGHLLSFMLTPVDKIFEYRVTGTVQKPVTKPIYIPKVVLEMLHPFHSLKESVAPAKPNENKEAPKSTAPSPNPAPTPASAQNPR